MLITVFFPGDPYRKAIINQDHVDYFLNLGASRLPPEKGKKQVQLEMPFNSVPKKGIELKAEEIQEVPKRSEPQTEIPSKVPEADKGFGKPGSMQFHTLEINQLDEYRPIRDYVFEVTRKKMREKKDGTPESYRKTALMLIKRWLNGS